LFLLPLLPCPALLVARSALAAIPGTADNVVNDEDDDVVVDVVAVEATETGATF
jgi:hypothetical protein